MSALTDPMFWQFVVAPVALPLFVWAILGWAEYRYRKELEGEG